MKVTKDIEKMLKEDGFCVTGFHGVSMLPMLREGEDRALIVPISGALKAGDVALFRRGEEYVMHRVAKKHGEFYIIRGDNCTERETVAAGDIVGVLKGFWRGADYYDCTGEYSAGFARRARFTLPVRRAKAFLRKIIAKLTGREKTNG